VIDEIQQVRDLAEARWKEGEASGKPTVILAFLAARGIAVNDEIRAHLEACVDTQTLYRWIARAVTAASAEEVIDGRGSARAITTGHDEVRYLPDDPAVNKPVAHARSQSERGAIAMGMGLPVLLAVLAAPTSSAKLVVPCDQPLRWALSSRYYGIRRTARGSQIGVDVDSPQLASGRIADA
jgi:hypothetical protein